MITTKAKNWKIQAGYIAKAAARAAGYVMPEKGVKVVVEIYAFWGNRQRHDMNNTHKLLMDAFEGIFYPDDCNALARDMDYDYDRKNPRLECYVYIKPEVETQCQL